MGSGMNWRTFSRNLASQINNRNSSDVYTPEQLRQKFTNFLSFLLCDFGVGCCHQSVHLQER